MENKLSDLEKSLALAECINMMKVPILMIDLEYLGGMSASMNKQAGFEDSAAVLNANYSPTKTQCIRKQAKALSLLKQYIECLKEIDALKGSINQENKNREDIMKLFL